MGLMAPFSGQPQPRVLVASKIIKSLSYGLCPVSEDETKFVFEESEIHKMMNAKENLTNL